MRCKCYTIKGNMCKNPSLKIKPICWVHLNKLYLKYILTIQMRGRSFLQGNNCRRVLKNIFEPLPEDLQRKIIFYIREPILIKKYQHKIIRKVLNNKLFTSAFYIRDVGVNPLQTFFNQDVVSNIEPIINIYRLFCKYISIVEDDKISWLLEQTNVLIHFSDIFLYNSDNHEIWMFLNHYLHTFRALVRIEKQINFED